MSNNKHEQSVSDFYNSIGWNINNGITEDAKRFEDLREYASEYVSKCRLRLLNYIPSNGKYILDMASGPIQFKEYLLFSRNFEKRYCVDLSKQALEIAEQKIGDHGVFVNKSFFDYEIEENYFDCSISLHTIYHIDKTLQEKCVRKLLTVTKRNHNVIIVYSNPNTFFLKYTYPILKRIKNVVKNIFKINSTNNQFYFYAHPIEWWSRFEDQANIEILPWRSFSSEIQKIIIPNNIFGKKLLDLLFKLENKFPKYFVKNFQYPMIILKKK